MSSAGLYQSQSNWEGLQDGLMSEGRPVEQKPAMPKCAVCCTFFSIFAAIFLVRCLENVYFEKEMQLMDTRTTPVCR